MSENLCRYCKKNFMRAESLAVHLCEQKRRFQEQGDRGVQLGMFAFLKFYEMTQGSAKLKTFEDFATSSYYRAFVKFGKHCVAIKAINPERFTEWVIKHNKKLDNWCKDELYSEYLLWYLQHEAVIDAITRTLEFSLTWGEETQHPAHDCLRYGNSNAMSYAISTGRISPWAIYNSESGQKFLSELNAEQLAMIWPYVNTDVWARKFTDYPADQIYAKDILAKAGW